MMLHPVCSVRCFCESCSVDLKDHVCKEEANVTGVNACVEAFGTSRHRSGMTST